jgi:hypothetical protein
MTPTCEMCEQPATMLGPYGGGFCNPCLARCCRYNIRTIGPLEGSLREWYANWKRSQPPRQQTKRNANRNTTNVTKHD